MNKANNIHCSSKLIALSAVNIKDQYIEQAPRNAFPGYAQGNGINLYTEALEDPRTDELEAEPHRKSNPVYQAQASAGYIPYDPLDYDQAGAFSTTAGIGAVLNNFTRSIEKAVGAKPGTSARQTARSKANRKKPIRKKPISAKEFQAKLKAGAKSFGPGAVRTPSAKTLSESTAPYRPGTGTAPGPQTPNPGSVGLPHAVSIPGLPSSTVVAEDNNHDYINELNAVYDRVISSPPGSLSQDIASAEARGLNYYIRAKQAPLGSADRQIYTLAYERAKNLIEELGNSPSGVYQSELGVLKGQLLKATDPFQKARLWEAYNKLLASNAVATAYRDYVTTIKGQQADPLGLIPAESKREYFLRLAELANQYQNGAITKQQWEDRSRIIGQSYGSDKVAEATSVILREVVPRLASKAAPSAAAGILATVVGQGVDIVFRLIHADVDRKVNNETGTHIDPPGIDAGKEIGNFLKGIGQFAGSIEAPPWISHQYLKGPESGFA